MAGDQDAVHPATSQTAESEYQALRAEILARNEFRQRMVELALISAGAILAAGVKIEDLELLLLLFPVAVFFLAASWAHHGVGVLLAGSYLQERHEAATGELGWEGAWRAHPLARPFSILAVLSSTGVFLSVELLTWGLGLTQVRGAPGNVVAAAIGGAAIVATALLMRYYSRVQRTRGRESRRDGIVGRQRPRPGIERRPSEEQPAGTAASTAP